MKGRFTRLNDPFGDRYSSVFHNEGQMVTATDLNDHGLAAAARVDALGDDTIKDGVPAVGGAVAIGTNGIPSLREGIIYADGVRGVLLASAAFSGPTGLFTQQADLPLGPALPVTGPQVIYADIWTRDVFPLEERHLVDPGLHGAETSFRGRTMTQIKAAPVNAQPEIETGTLRFPRIGNAVLNVQPRSAAAQIDECDPCADVVAVDQKIANALFRIEVIHVEGPANAPQKIALAWSMENASALVPAAAKTDLLRAGAVYQYCSKITETRRGVFANWQDAKQSAFVDNLTVTLSPATDHDGGSWPLVRRWDGYALLNLAAGAVGQTLGSGFTIGFAAGKIALTVDVLDATLAFAGKSFVAGDYWLTELRTFAAAADKVRLIRPTPFGILHHYCVLFTTNATGIPVALTDAEQRKLSFPTLSNVPADHVGLSNNCPKLYGNAKNVQQALDNLCSIAADDIAFTDKCPKLYSGATNVQQALDNLCGIAADDIAFTDTCTNLYGGATNVQDALSKLCGITAGDIGFTDSCDLFAGVSDVAGALHKLCDADFSNARDYRLLFDWGVLCGLKVRAPDPKKIRIDAGSFLDRSGRVGEFGGDTVDPNNEAEVAIHKSLAEPLALAEAFSKDEVCLAVARVGTARDKTKLYLVRKSDAFGPSETGYLEAVQACMSKHKIFDYEKMIAEEPSASTRSAIAMMTATAQNWDTLSNSVAMDRTLTGEAWKFNNRMREQFNSVAATEDVARLDADLAALATRYGVVLDDYARTRYLTEQYNVIVRSEAERRRQCLCEHFPPPCPPPPGDPPYLVPIACVKGDVDGGGNITVREICLFGCRKQAITWRSANYWLSAYRSSGEAWLHKLCCPPTRKIGYSEVPGKYAGATLGTFTELSWLGDFVRGNAPLTGADQPYVGVTGMTAKDAGAALSNAGFLIAETIDTSDAGALQKFLAAGAATLDERIKDPAPPKPGDGVALLMGEDGKTIGYVLKTRGGAAWSAATGELTRVTTELRGEVTTLRTALDAVNYDNDKVRSELASLRGALASTDNEKVRFELASLRGALDAVNADSEKVRSELASLRSTLANTDNEKVRSELASLRGTLANTDNEKVRSELASLRGALDAVNADSEKVRSELASLRSTLANTDNEKVRSELASLRGALASVNADHEKVRSELASLRGTLASTDNEKVRSELASLRGALASVNADNEKVRSELVAARAEFATLAATLRTAVPITALPIAPALSAKLMEQGIYTVADMANLTPATIKKLDASGVIKADELTKLIALAKVMKGG